MGKKILIFTGAGISAPLGLPTTAGFQDTIESIPGKLLERIRTFLPENEVNDIEKILYLLEDYTREKDFTMHTLKTLPINIFSQVENQIVQRKGEAAYAIQQIKTDIFEILRKFDRKRASKLYSSIIKEIKSEYGKETSFSIFTTNYDLTFENGLGSDFDTLDKMEITDILYGFGGGRNGRQIYNAKEEFNWELDKIEYKKLHGSLDWNLDEDDNCVKTGTALDPKNPQKMPMLYPGFKGTPTKQPFVDIHERLDQRLNTADVAFVLGFAFRDDFINNIFEYSLKRNEKLSIHCYNPSKLEDFPNDSKLKYFVDKYPKRFFHAQKPIKVEDRPLDLKGQLLASRIAMLPNNLFLKESDLKGKKGIPFKM